MVGVGGGGYGGLGGGGEGGTWSGIGTINIFSFSRRDPKINFGTGGVNQGQRTTCQGCSPVIL